jgi:hypothetical protein
MMWPATHELAVADGEQAVGELDQDARNAERKERRGGPAAALASSGKAKTPTAR